MTVAAVDLGSNSFHLIVASSDGGRTQVLDRMKEMVRLAEGLDDGNALQPAAVARALDCLRRFGQRLRGLPPENVRVVGTNTLRKARDAAQFIESAERVLGHRIDVISGLEEARLIYLGVSHSLDDDGRRRLVIDIGGGSTEVIVGRRFEAEYMESLHIGCVGLSSRVFGDGEIDAKRFRRAELLALQEFEPHRAHFRDLGWESSIGASGTIIAVRDVVTQQGWARDVITSDALARLQRAMIGAGHVYGLKLAGLQSDRAPVFPGGVAILCAAFAALGIESMRVADGALREGLVYDLLGRIHHEDVRERTIDELIHRYRLDQRQSERVRDLAVMLLRRVQSAGPFRPEQERLLAWAARVHEIGLVINHSQYQKHGAYLLENLDLPGFARDEQRALAFLVRTHRRKFPREQFEQLAADEREVLLLPCIALRLAVLLHRARSDAVLPEIEMEWRPDSVRVRFADRWLEDNALTEADLEQEAEYLKVAGVKLKYR